MPTKAELEARVEELEDEARSLDDVTAVEAHCSSIPVDWHEIGGVRVGLDAAGNAVRVEFPAQLYGWSAE